MAKEKDDAVVSPEKAKLLAIIEAYKKANPAKAKLKEAEFAKKLAALN